MELKPENLHWLHELSHNFFNKTVSELRENLIDKLDLLAFLNETLFEEKVNIDEYEISSEGLVIKFFLHGQSVVKISEGYTLSSKYFDNEKFEKNKFIDLSSLLTVGRAQLECLLMYNHIYVNPTDTDEEKLRYYAWIYTALIQRKNVPTNSDDSKAQKARDEVQINDLKIKIQSSKSFKLLSPKQQISLIENGSGKLFKHWNLIFKESGYIEEGIFNKLYYLLSVHSHSEGLSVMQLQTVKYDLKTKQNQDFSFLQVLSSLIMTCSMIKNITSRFPAIEERYNLIDEKTRYSIYFYSEIPKRDPIPPS